MSGGANDDDLGRARDAFAGQLARCSERLARARDDDEILAVRDLLLDVQFESRALITAAEERLGAFSGEDDPRALAVHAEALIEQVEALQDAWESRVGLLLEAGFDNARLPAFLADALARPDGVARLEEFFAGLPADMDQTGEALDYAKRYLLSLLDGPGPRRPGGGREGEGGRKGEGDGRGAGGRPPRQPGRGRGH